MPRSQLLNALLVTTALVAVPVALARAQTLPSGGQVASGQASIATPAPGQMTIQQSSPTAIVNWQSFSVGQGGRVDIRQPSADAAMLNRVTGATPSSIAGQVNANGRVYLVNPNGIAIGPTGEVRAQGFVASTLDIADDDFRAGRRNFQGNGASAAVSNAGRIEVGRGGYAALLGGQVSNAGTISAPAGRIGLGAAERATLDLSGDGFLQVTLPSAAAGTEALVTNSGTLSAPGGRVELSAATAREAARRAVNMSGVIEANAVSAQGGTIVLSGGPGGEVAVSGRLDASSAEARGGSATVTGQAIALQGARVDASGATGGGRVRVGGDREGRGPLPRAERVRADAATTIRADATQRGSGGDVVVWSENRTDFAGRIEARGGPQGGDGGQAEVSSRTVLNYTGTTDLRAAAGEWGTLLLDPYDITISTGTTSNATGFTATGNDSVINAADLVTALGLANVTVSTGTGGTQAGNITVATPLAWNTSSTLTLQAAGGINLNAAITAPAGALALQAVGTIGASGDITVQRFELLGGAWMQNAATLAGLTAGDFRLTGGTFLRAVGGAGTSGDPWRLADVYGLQGMATRLDGHYRLANDIAAAGTASWNDGAGFRPVGTFTGSLDGAGHTISGLTINRPGEDNVGLFGATAAGSTISNIGLVGGAVTGGNRVGGLVGTNSGTITQAYATGAVTGSNYDVGGLVGENQGTITQAYATGTVTGGDNVGGLAGGNAGTITQAYATGAVTGGDNVGGLVGGNDPGGTITQAYATGAVAGDGGSVGGLVGINGGTITQAYAMGEVTGGYNVGGLVGTIYDGSITHAYATGAVTGLSDSVGGLVGINGGTIAESFWDTQTTGRSTSDGGTGLTTAEARDAGNYTGWIFTTDWFHAGDMRPIGRWEAAPEISGVRVIRNLNQLQLMAANLGASYRLGADINVALTNATASSPGIWGAGGFVPVGTEAAPFAGSLDGAGRGITGLTINRPSTDHVGLIGWAGSGSSFRNLGLTGISVTGRNNVGGLVGTNFGHITQAQVTGTVVGNSFNVGGMVGWNQGTIMQSHSNVAVTGQSSAGGLVGANAGTITQAYATGAVAGTASVGGLAGRNFGPITQTYATGAVSGDADTGGLVGGNGRLGSSNPGTITASFWDTATTGRGTAAGRADTGSVIDATGRTTAQMQDINTFRTTYAGWDFDTVWAPPNQVGQNNDAATAFYPELYSLSNVVAVFVPNASREYGDANPAPVATYRGLRPGDTIGTLATLGFQGTAPTATSSAGTTHALTASGTTVNSPAGRAYRLVHVPGSLTIAPRAITVTADAQTREYGDANPTLTYGTARSGGATGPALVNGDTLTGALATSATTTSPVAAYPITRGDLQASPNYALTFVGTTLSVVQRPPAPQDVAANIAQVLAGPQLLRLRLLDPAMLPRESVIDTSRYIAHRTLGGAAGLVVIDMGDGVVELREGGR